MEPRSDDALAVVSAYQDAWTRKDFDAAARYIDDAVEFQSPQQRLQGADAFFTMLRRFAERIGEGWELVSAATSEGGVLILYNLFSGDRTPLPCADFFTVRDGRITSELLVFDAQAFAPPPQ